MHAPNIDSASSASPFVLNGVHIEPGLNRVSRDGEECHLEPQVMKLLLFLAANVETTVDRETLMEEVWPGSEPNEEALTQAVSKLRKALGDADRSLIRTVRKVGYRLHGPVHRVAPALPPSPSIGQPLPLSRSRARRPWRMAIPVAAIALFTLMASRIEVVTVHHDVPLATAALIVDEAQGEQNGLNGLATLTPADSARVVTVQHRW